MKNVISWFEIPVTDFDRAIKFYSKIMGVKLDSQEMAGFKMAFFPVEQGGISGALVKGDVYVPTDNGPLIYLNGGDDLNSVLNKVEGAGGKVIVPKKLITEDVGYFALFLDTEGNRMGLFSMK